MKVKVSVSLDYELWQNLKLLAELSDRSVSSYVNMILKRAIAGQKIERK